MKILYLHGLNSAFNPNNEKVLELEKIGEVIAFSYDSLSSPASIEKVISTFIVEADIEALAGTSYGGYWAMILGKKFKLPSIAINPAIEPKHALTRAVIKNKGIFVNYVTGACETMQVGVQWEFKKVCADFEPMPLIAVDLEDEVIDSHKTIESIGVPVIAYAGGSHRFDHMKSFAEHVRVYLSEINE